MQTFLEMMLHEALHQVRAPINIIISSIIIPYALDRSFTWRYQRMRSDKLSKIIKDEEKFRWKPLHYYDDRWYDSLDRWAKALEEKKRADALATMNRYPSFISDEWISSVQQGSEEHRFHSIEYMGSYDACQVSMNDEPVALIVGCPASPKFYILAIPVGGGEMRDIDTSAAKLATRRTGYCELCGNGLEDTDHSECEAELEENSEDSGYGTYLVLSSIEKYIAHHTKGCVWISQRLREFAHTGVITAENWAQFWHDPCTYVPVVVHAYFRLKRMVELGACLSPEDCGVCSRQTYSTLPFPEELYDC